MAFRSVSLLMLFLLWITVAQGQNKLFDVTKYGAVADGKTDDSKAFSNAWSEACQWKGRSWVMIPPGTYMVGPVLFNGPCKSPVVFTIKGTLKAPIDRASLNVDHWIRFQYIDQLTVNGGGTFDGQGASAWPYNQCGKVSNCKLLPISIRFDFVTNSRIQNIRSVDSKNFHMNIFKCNNIDLNNIKIMAPEDSPNTDGIHIGDSSDIRISDLQIGTGDDCISLGPGSKNINITRVFCGPGHGISVGSLGKLPNEDDVVGLTVRNCTFTGTSNGVRIKTWAPSPPSIASDFTFEDIIVNNVFNPIIIDQQYCPYGFCNHKAASNVRISEIRFRNIRGTSSSKIAVNLHCSRSAPCQEIELKDINLAYNGVEGPGAVSSCSNVKGVANGQQKPPPCI